MVSSREHVILGDTQKFPVRVPEVLLSPQCCRYDPWRVRFTLSGGPDSLSYYVMRARDPTIC